MCNLGKLWFSSHILIFYAMHCGSLGRDGDFRIDSPCALILATVRHYLD